MSNSSSSEICALPPQRIVEELDRFVIGQQCAKRAVALALRNRWRRQRLEAEMRNEITPKKHPHDRPHRRRQDGDRKAYRPTVRSAVHQGRGHEVHRDRVRRPGRGIHRPRSGRRRGKAGPGAGPGRGARGGGGSGGGTPAAGDGSRRGRLAQPGAPTGDAAFRAAGRTHDRDRAPHSDRRGDHGTPRAWRSSPDSCGTCWNDSPGAANDSRAD